ncbi:MAG TPA: hypothetical protein VHH90_06690 [Polyangia bacterium]|nr:hypothetical protein [Polyangia bacterium]
MLPPCMLRRWIALAALIGGCGASGAARPPLPDARVDAHLDGGNRDRPSDLVAESRPARCCVVPTFSSNSPYAGCNLLNLVPDATSNLIQPCWDGDGGNGYGRWQCGGQSGQDAWCASGGLNCDVNDLCWVRNSDSTAGGCIGSVQPCAYPWP